jgi:hypothetical protein
MLQGMMASLHSTRKLKSLQPEPNPTVIGLSSNSNTLFKLEPLLTP